ncbi:hypothetical protein BDZ97DRAFT_1845437 [Flammula alnicola]|nr:hypothetical protein BDZ97DRAFT_1845437 [Flammula alnicola]
MYYSAPSTCQTTARTLDPRCSNPNLQKSSPSSPDPSFRHSQDHCVRIGLAFTSCRPPR